MNLEIGRIGPLVIDHVMVVNNTEQERSRLLLNMEENFAKEMPKRFKFVTLNLAQVSLDRIESFKPLNKNLN